MQLVNLTGFLLLLGLGCTLAIRNGFSDEYRSYLFQVHITTGAWFSRGNELCAGSAIGDFHVLTAGHCVWDTDTKKLLDYRRISLVRRLSLVFNKFQIAATAVHTHPKLGAQKLSGGGNYLAYDVGIVTVKERLGGIYLKLPAVGVSAPVGKQLLAGAWGYIEPNGPNPAQIKYGYFTVLSREEGARRLQGNTVPAEMFCVANGKTTPALCKGDSGAPIYNVDTHTVYGVASTGFCGELDVATIVDLSNKEVHDWVVAYTT